MDDEAGERLGRAVLEVGGEGRGDRRLDGGSADVAPATGDDAERLIASRGRDPNLGLQALASGRAGKDAVAALAPAGVG